MAFKPVEGWSSLSSTVKPMLNHFNLLQKVETWLLRLEETMKGTVRHSITEAIAAYEEKPRELWILDFPAQVALTGSQIWWTTDVVIAFSRLEGSGLSSPVVMHSVLRNQPSQPSTR